MATIILVASSVFLAVSVIQFSVVLGEVSGLPSLASPSPKAAVGAAAPAEVGLPKETVCELPLILVNHQPLPPNRENLLHDTGCDTPDLAQVPMSYTFAVVNEIVPKLDRRCVSHKKHLLDIRDGGYDIRTQVIGLNRLWHDAVSEGCVKQYVNK